MLGGGLYCIILEIVSFLKLYAILISQTSIKIETKHYTFANDSEFIKTRIHKKELRRKLYKLLLFKTRGP